MPGKQVRSEASRSHSLVRHCTYKRRLNPLIELRPQMSVCFAKCNLPKKFAAFQHLLWQRRTCRVELSQHGATVYELRRI